MERRDEAGQDLLTSGMHFVTSHPNTVKRCFTTYQQTNQSHQAADARSHPPLLPQFIAVTTRSAALNPSLS